MKKRVLSALLALCMACTLAGNVWAAEETEPTPAPSAGVEAQTVEPQTVEPTPSAEPTQAPAPSPDATAEPEATPEPSAAPSAAPDATVEPDATPAPTEEPEATAAPAATATPDATAEPTATPAPTEAPAPTATPEPSDAPEATAAPAVSYVAPVQTAEDQQINVHVDVPEGAFAENVAPTLHAQLITGETEEEQAELDKAAAQVAEQTGAAFDGMLALDVYFTDANAEDPEQEIEPALPVSVRFELSENVLPEGYDPATLAVHHLAEEKDAAGEPVTDENGEAAVTVETVANAVTDDAEVPGVVALSDAAAEAAEAPAEVARIADLPAPETAATPADEQAAAEAEQALTDPAVVAEFEVESFSTFTITWNADNSITVYLVDRQGNELFAGGVDFGDLSNKYNPTDFANKYITNQWVSIEELASTWAAKTEGYTYVGAYRAQRGQSFQSNNQIYWLRCNTETRGYGDNAYEVFDGWRYLSSVNAPTYSSGTAWTDRNNYHLYLVYDEVDEAEENEELSIKDTVATNGKYTVVNNGTGTYFVWEKSEDGQDWQVINRTKMNADQYNVTESGDELNIVLEVVNDEEDVGGRWFRVSAYTDKDAYDAGEDPLAVSTAKQLAYYDELRNGDFEEPVVIELTSGNKSNYQYPVGTDGLIWNTTGSDRQIEIVNSRNHADESDYNNDDGAQRNSQYAELNCEASGALYQDVMTVPGTELNWQFYHRARGNKGGNDYTTQDTMYLVIAPTDAVKNITTQDDLIELINDIQRYPNQYEGYYVKEVTSNRASWHHYSSEDDGSSPYEVPEGQYLTRFFFVAGDTASGNAKVGNLLDNVAFTTGLLPAEDGEANLTITKVVTGVSAEDMANYSVEFQVTGSGTNVTQTLTGAQFTQQSGGSYTATWQTTIDEIPGNGSKEFTVTETPANMSKYDATGSTVSVNNGAASEGTQTSITLKERGSGTVTFTNSYAAKQPPEAPQHHKKATLIEEGENQGKYNLTLDVIGTSSEITQTTDLNVLMVIDRSQSMEDLMSTVKSAAKSLIGELEELKQTGGLGTITYDVVQFAALSQTSTVLEWNSNSDQAKSAIDRVSIVSSGQGTNWEAGINEAISDLNSQSKPDTKTCVIFFTDGDPNRAVETYNGYQYQTDYSWNEDGAATEAANAAKSINVDYYFGIGAFVDSYNTEDSRTRLEKIENAVTASSKDTYVTNNAGQIANIFGNLAEQIKIGYTNVIITDTLSGNVEFASENPRFKVTVTKPGENGEEPTDVTQEEIAAGMSVQVVQDTSNPKKFTWSLGEDYMLKNGYTYTLSVIIEPSQSAENTFASSGVYPDTPDPGTGTHADENEKGFFSNETDTAKLTYTHSSWEEPLHDDYDDPVVQVPSAKLTIVKNVDGLPVGTSSNATYTFEIQVPTTMNGTYNGVTFKNGKATVTITGDGEKVIDSLPMASYTVTETGTDKLVDITADDGKAYYFAGVQYGDDSEATKVTADLSTGDKTVTITNTYKPYRTVTITKNVTGEMGDTTKQFTFNTTIKRGENAAVYVDDETIEIGSETVNAELKEKDNFVSNGYTLANGEYITISKLKDDDILTIAESGANQNGYETSYTVNGATNQNGAVTISADLANAAVDENGEPDNIVKVVVTNTRKVVTPTGLESNHTKPYALMVGAGALAGLALVGGILARRARRRREW